jgi:multidrug efflux pump subunit AcrA (membrane-fusion protein)
MNTRRDRASRPWYLYVMGLIAIAIVVLAITQIGPPSSSARTSREIVSAEQGVVQSTVTGSGNIAAGTDVDVNFNASGTLQNVYVSEGQHVSEGQLLATLDPTSAQLSLNQAEENLTAAEDNLSCLQGVTSDCGSGGSSGAGGSGAGSSAGGSGGSGGSGSASNGSASTTSYSAPAGTVEYAAFHPGGGTGSSTTPGTPTTPGTSKPKTGTGGSSTTTTKAGSVTVTVIVPPSTTRSTTPSSSSAGNSAGKTTSTPSAKTTSTPTTTTTSTPSPGSIASAQADVYSAEAAVHSAQIALNNTKLYAPTDGTIASISSLSPGDTVSAGSSGNASNSSSSSSSSSSSGSGVAGATAAGSLGGSSGSSGSSGSGSGSAFAEIVDTNALTMTVAFSEADISKVSVGQPATVSLDALPGVELAAHVSSISLVGSTSSSVVSFDSTLTLDQADSQVKPGMSASATVITGQAQGVTVPNQAITGSGSLASVELFKNGKTVPQQVVVGLRGDTRSQIISGVNPGQQLAITIALPSLTSTPTTSSGTGTLGGGGLGGGGLFRGGGGLGGGGGGAFFRGGGGG